MFKTKLIIALTVVGIGTWILWAWLFYDEDKAVLREVKTYRCAVVPEMFGVEQWQHCCVALDQDYWRGGRSSDWRKTNSAFRGCLEEVYPESFVPMVVYYSSFVAGVPFLPTPVRWGYGWKFGHGFRDAQTFFQEQ